MTRLQKLLDCTNVRRTLLNVTTKAAGYREGWGILSYQPLATYNPWLQSIIVNGYREVFSVYWMPSPDRQKVRIRLRRAENSQADQNQDVVMIAPSPRPILFDHPWQMRPWYLHSCLQWLEHSPRPCVARVVSLRQLKQHSSWSGS